MNVETRLQNLETKLADENTRCAECNQATVVCWPGRQASCGRCAVPPANILTIKVVYTAMAGDAFVIGER